MTMGPNGTMNVPGMPGTSISAPPGSNVTGIKITQEPNGYGVRADISPPPPQVFHLVNTSWTIYNSTSGSTGTVTFTSVGPDHIEMKDQNGGTIDLMR